jgi:NAD(P)-dependent dehydrogenase (short-subunit alcohol dehydrogenase family)
MTRRALVTGAAGGIGRAVVAEMHKRGMTVVGLDVQAGGGVIACDVSDSAAVDAAVADAVVRLGGLDVVVNIVGISGRRLGDGPVDQCTDEAIDLVLQTNVASVFYVCRAALAHLGAGASIVNLTSVLGLRGGAPEIFETHAYAASKGAVISLTKAMAASYAPRGIRVNAVAPGLVRTPMSERAQGNEAVLAESARRQPLVGPLLEPEQVAAAIGFLCDTESDGITGVVLPVDGGWTAT